MVNFLSLKKIIVELYRKIVFALISFFYENGLAYPVYVSNEKCENCINLLVITDENKSHYVYVKDVNRSVIRQKIRIKNTFADIVYNVLVVKEFW